MPQLDQQIQDHIKQYDQVGSLTKIIEDKNKKFKKEVDGANDSLRNEIQASVDSMNNQLQSQLSRDSSAKDQKIESVMDDIDKIN